MLKIREITKEDGDYYIEYINSNKDLLTYSGSAEDILFDLLTEIVKEKNMTSKDMFEEAFPQDKQIGGSHYKDFHIQPYEFISKNDLSFFQGNVIKYVCRYMNKNGIQDLEKVIHYCELEIKKDERHEEEKIMLKLEQINTNRGKFLTINNDLYIPEALRKYGGWENEVYRECIQHLKPNSVVIEVGAHIGTHTIPFAMYCPKGYIFAFEMQRFINQILNTNIIINGVKNVQTFQEAVTDEDGPFVTNDFRYDVEGINTGNTKIQFMDEMKQGFLPIYKCTLDKKFNHLNRLDLIKIDVECHEHFVIKGGLELIKKHKPVIMTEYHTVKTEHTNGNQHLIKELLPNYSWKEIIGKYELNNKIIYNLNMIGVHK